MTQTFLLQQAIYRMRGHVGVPEGDINTPDDAADQLFASLDKNRDHKLSDMEFIIGAKSCPEILGILQATHTHTSSD